MFFGHMPELVILLVLGLVVFGPKRLPELGSSLGSSIKEFRKATSEVQNSLTATPALPLPMTQDHEVARVENTAAHVVAEARQA